MTSNLETIINNILKDIEDRKSYKGNLLEKYVKLRLEKSFSSYQDQLQKDLIYLKNRDLKKLLKKL